MLWGFGSCHTLPELINHFFLSFFFLSVTEDSNVV